ncbi:MAG: hypothetical protein ACLFTK_01010 [Anaerolineales bacterium]
MLWRSLCAILGASLLLSLGIMSLARRAEPQPPWIVFAGGPDDPQQIYRIHPDGSGLQRLTNHPQARATAPVYTPDGRQVIFRLQTYPARDYTLVRMSVVGSRPQAFAPAQHALSPPSFAPDGTRMTYIHLHFDPRAGRDLPEVMVASTQGADARALTNGGIKYQAQWSPSGEWIAFEYDGDIFRVDPAGGRPQQLTYHYSLDGHPTWSPDGARLAFASSQTGDMEIYHMAANGLNIRRVTNYRADDLMPAWSPDGEWIAFVRFDAQANEFALYRIRPDGTHAQRLTPPGMRAADPAWSPAVDLPLGPLPGLLGGLLLALGTVKTRVVFQYAAQTVRQARLRHDA